MQVLSDDSIPLENRYDKILSNLDPIERCIALRPWSVSNFESELLQLLRPHPQLAPNQTYDFNDDEGVPSNAQCAAIDSFRLLSKELLSLLDNPDISLAPSADAVAVFAAFSSTADLWTSPETQALSKQLLLQYSGSLLSREILIDGLLVSTLKPLFALRTSSAARVTTSGRIAIRESTNPRIIIDTPEWVKRRPESVAILEWIFERISHDDIEAAWGLLIPPLLTLIDSIDSPTKVRAISMLTAFLQRLTETPTTRTLLERTGLVPVFWDAVMPCLSSLPPLTPTAHSIPLLRASYGCLLFLTRAREKANIRKRVELLDQLVRDGFLRGVKFADDNVHVVTVMTEKLERIIEEMGIWAVKHLKSIVPALADILSSPFGYAFPPLLTAAARTLSVVILVCWPRMDAYVAEIVRAVAVCWGRIVEEERSGRLLSQFDVKKELVNAIGLVKAVVLKMEGGAERWMKLQEGIQSVDSSLFNPLFG